MVDFPVGELKCMCCDFLFSLKLYIEGGGGGGGGGR